MISNKFTALGMSILGIIVLLLSRIYRIVIIIYWLQGNKNRSKRSRLQQRAKKKKVRYEPSPDSNRGLRAMSRYIKRLPLCYPPLPSTVYTTEPQAEAYSILLLKPLDTDAQR